MRRPLLLVLLSALTLIGTAGAAAAAPGDLDQTFGDSGLATVDLGGSDFASVIAQRPDGRILVGGRQEGGTGNGSDGIVAQLLPDSAALDSTYGLGSGWSRLDRSSDDAVTDVALRPDGRIVVSGYASDDNPVGGLNGLVARFLSVEGTLDSSFGGGGGVAIVPFGGADVLTGLALQPDGRVVVAGYSFLNAQSDGIFARLLETEGTFDDTFADGTGAFAEDFGSADMQADDVALQADGKIVYTGNIQTNGSRNMIIGRLLNPEGDNDPTFGGGSGRTVIDLGGFDYGASMAVQPDGKIVVAGARVVTPSGPGDDFAVARVLPNGLPDPTFAGDGSATIDFGSSERGAGVVVQPDGKILVVGGIQPGTSGKDDIAVARLLTNGSLDPGFGTGGRSIIDFGAWEDGLAIALRPDGRILVAGSTKPTPDGPADIAIARLQGRGGPSGSVPAAGGPGGAAGVSALCAGRRATIVGTPGRDRLRGTPGPDVVAALGGDDVVTGLGGADVVCGGAGKDRLTGGAGADRLIGGAGADTLTGGAGKDSLEGGPAADKLVGGAGADRLLGGAGPDSLVGGGGVDALLGGAGRNVRVQ